MALFVVCAAPLFASGVFAVEDIRAAGGDNKQKTIQQAKSQSFVYQYQDRKDPFMPFITGNTDSEDEIIDSGEPLTGMQLIEPGQLTLVGLLNKGGEYYAVAEDSTGKGYILTQGMKIGRRGFIREIGPGKVSIEETTVSRAGTKPLTQIDMVLKKEGGK